MARPIKDLEDSLNSALREEDSAKANQIFDKAEAILKDTSNLPRVLKARLRTIKRRILDFRLRDTKTSQRVDAQENDLTSTPEDLHQKQRRGPYFITSQKSFWRRRRLDHPVSD